MSAWTMRRSVDSSKNNVGVGTSESPFASAARGEDGSGSGHGMVKPKPLRLDVGCHSPIEEEEEYVGQKEYKLTPFGSLRGFGCGTGNQYHTPLVRCLVIL